MHFFNGTLAFIFSILYLFFSLPSIYPTVAVVEVSLNVLKISGWAYMVIAAVHWYALLRITRRSLRARQLTFSSPTKKILGSPTPSSCVTRLGARLSSLYRAFWKPWNLLFGVDGIFGVNGRYFYIAFLAREILEVVLQTYQAVQLSGSVRRPWITNLAVATIVLNSFSTPLVYALLHRHQESARRFMSILVDMSLDFCCAALIPICVVYPYIAEYNISMGSMPLTRTYDDVWFASSLIEIRQFCVTSLLDFLATMVPQITVFMCLNLAQKLVGRDTRGDNGMVENRIKSKRLSMTIVVAPESSSTTLVHHWPHLPPTMTRPFTSHRLHTIFHTIMILWSGTILLVHIRSSYHANMSRVQGCRLYLNAWTAARTPCSVMQINCYRFGIDGSAEEVAHILGPLDRAVLRKLIITHCVSLEVPPLLGQFSEMTDLDLYNTTITSWPLEAAATPSTLKSLVNFNWFRSPFIRFPAGLLHRNLPRGFARFSISRSNITELPHDIGTLWSHHTFDVFSLQFTDIGRLPRSFRDLKASKIRLISNRIELIDDDAFATKQPLTLYLSGNPLRAFPASIGATTSLLTVVAEHTNISNLPPQLLNWWYKLPSGLFSKHTMSMYGSPLCERMAESTFCLKDHGTVSGTYPWNIIEPQRGLDM